MFSNNISCSKSDRDLIHYALESYIFRAVYVVRGIAILVRRIDTKFMYLKSNLKNNYLLII